jgi:hypothetical protein
MCNVLPLFQVVSQFWLSRYIVFPMHQFIYSTMRHYKEKLTLRHYNIDSLNLLVVADSLFCYV